MALPLPGLEPIFPPELEREIFERSALSDSGIIPRLILVAHRVKIWIEPFLYSIISVEPPSLRNHTKRQIPEDILLAALESKPMSIWRDHTRHLSVGLPAGENMARILSMCSRTSDLALFHTGLDRDFQYARFLPLMAVMPLVRLSTSLFALFHGQSIIFGHPIFAHITHLNLLDTDSYRGCGWAEGLGHLPYLTHISFDFPSSPYPSSGHGDFLRDVFMHCTLIEVFIVRCRNDEDVRCNIPHYTYLADDPRSVLLGVVDLLEDWEIGAKGGEDYWVRAERFIKQRQSGEVSVRDYAIFLQELDNGEPRDDSP